MGLVIGVVSVVLSLSWIKHELEYDSFHEKSDRIYKISKGDNFSIVPPLYNSLIAEFPEIEKIIRVTNDAEAFINNSNNNNMVKVNDVLYSNSDFDDIFSCNTICGDIQAALNSPNGIILTKETAIKIFGKTNIEGKLIHYTTSSPPKKMMLTVMAVVDNFPDNSTLKFDAIIPFNALDNIKPNGMKPDDNWRDGYCNIYILLKKDIDAYLFTTKLEEFGKNVDKLVYGIEKKSPRAAQRKRGLVNIADLHFFNTNKKQLVGYIGVIGLLIMLIALSNYVNLSVANLFSNYQTLFVRKINGATRYQIALKILAESVLYSLFAFLIAFFFILIFKSFLSDLLNFDLNFTFNENWFASIVLVLAAILIGLIAGIYPALKLTSNIPVNIVQSKFIKNERHSVRQFLVVFQFTISIALIICVFVISNQINFLKKKDLGFNNQQIIYTRLNKNLSKPYKTFKEKLLQNPNIKNVSGSQDELGQICVTLTREINGVSRYFQELPVDPDFIETMGLELKMGRNFSWELQTDRYQTLILNETAVKDFNLDKEQIIGTEVYMYDRVAKVIGVVNDFYFESFHKKLDPFMFYYHPGAISTANIKIRGNNIPATIKYIQDVWDQFSPDIPFEYHFLDKTYEKLYEQDRQFSKIIISFLVVAILIACLGLFGLATITTIQRTKEIGIRKINGANVSEILSMLNKDFIKWVAIAFVVACPIAYIAMTKWLENFAYKTELSWWIFALAGVLALGIALLTVSCQSWKAATRNPVEALRYE
jgi:putative ABC transport system permease protein